MRAAFSPTEPGFSPREPEQRAPRWARRVSVGAAIAVDAAAANLCILLAFLVRFDGSLPPSNWAAFRHLGLPLTGALLVSYSLAGLYVRLGELGRAEIASAVVRGNVLWLFASFAIAYLQRGVGGAYPTSVLFLSAAFHGALSFWIHLGWEHLRRTHLAGPGRGRRAVLIGATAEARRLREAALAGRGSEYAFVATFETFEDRPARAVDGGALDFRQLLRDEKVEVVILADPNLPVAERLRYAVKCAGLDVRLKVVPTLFELLSAPGRAKLVAGVPLVDFLGDEMPTMRDMARRIFDLTAAVAGLAVALPIWPLVALAVKLSSPGRVLYRQERVGLGGRTFHMLKFRTMRMDAEAHTGPVLAAPDDQRVTAVGRFLRVSRLDELPQLLNVLKGDMSLVGPRPERPYFVGQFLGSVPKYPERYHVRPGITGLAQVRAGYDLSARNKARYDLLYIKNRSFWLDLKILAKTVVVVVGGHGAR